MVFVRLAKVLAWAIVIVGILSIGYGFSLIFAPMAHGVSPDQVEAFVKEHGLPKTIPQGFVVLIVGIALGALAHIGDSYRKAY